jgi:hypothetical protein
VRLNLGDCYVRLGKTASAWTILGEAETIAERVQDQSAAELAHRRRAELEPGLARLTIDVPVAARAEGLEVLRDGKPVIAAAWGMAVPVDPGAHVVEARAPGKKPRRHEVVLKPDGDRQTLTLAALEAEPSSAMSAIAPAPAPILAAPSDDATAATAATSGSGQRTLGWVLGGVGLVGAGVGTALALSGASERRRRERREGRLRRGRQPDDGGLRDRRDRRGRARHRDRPARDGAERKAEDGAPGGTMDERIERRRRGERTVVSWMS